jgi:DNA-binding CsgD family transcriptional regulator
VIVAAAGGGIVRLAEWRRVREFASSGGNSPAVLALQGEAGAGKSTLWRGGVAAAREAGHRVMRTEPSAGEADMSFAGLSDLLSEVLPEVAADLPAPQLEALEVALLLRAAGPEPPTAHAVGLATLAALRACASTGQVLIAIDDVQWLDEASIEALTFAFRRITDGGLTLLMAARNAASADPITAGQPAPSRAWRSLLTAFPAPELIDLAPLDMWQIQSLLPDSVTTAQADLVARQSRGNPFWAKEIMASLQAGATTVPPLALGLTERLARLLSAAAAEALTLVAAAGRIRLPEALALLGYLDDPAAAVDGAVLAGVLIETADRLAVSHPLIAAAAVDALPPGRRSQLYRRLADASADSERRGHFAALAAGAGPDPVVADALEAAADAAHARAGNAAAAQFADRAVTFTPEQHSEALVHRRIKAGKLLFLAGEIRASLGQLKALDIDRLTTPDLEHALPMLLDMSDLVHGPATATAIIAHSVDCAGDEPRRRALVLALASDYAYGIRGSRRAAAVEAISCAERAGSDAAPSLHRALINLVVAKVYAAEGLDEAVLERAERLEADLPAVQLHDTADLHRGVWSAFVNDLDTARQALGRCIDRARAAGDDYPLSTFLSYLATVEHRAGDFVAAATTLDAERVVARWHDWPLSAWHLKPRCEQLIGTGSPDEALRLVDAHLPDGESTPLFARFVGACVRGRVSMWSGDNDGAVHHLEEAARHADQLEWQDPGLRDRIDADLAEAHVTVGRLDDARNTASWLRELGSRLNRPALVGDAARIDALALAQQGELDAAAELARAAVATHGASPLRAELARSLLVLGRIERRRKARKESRTALHRALELATECRHRPLAAQIEHELPRVAAARSGTDLTATEQRVASLIGGGATNREVAAALFVSVRTVETHVASIYRKLGLRTRTELVRHYSGASRR